MGCWQTQEHFATLYLVALKTLHLSLQMWQAMSLAAKGARL